MSKFTCRRKRRYATAEDAEAVINVMPRDNRWQRLHAYPCGDHFHVGHDRVKVDKSVYK